MSKHKLFLLDAMAILYRAHFAFINNPRRTTKGLNTSAIFGFTNTLLEIINKEDPSHLAIAFDTDKPTFRHDRFPDYKGHREDKPEDLDACIPYVYRMLEILDIPKLELDGYEADDIIGTIAWGVPESEYEVYMVTPDKDFAQLVRDNVFLYRPRYKVGGFDVMGIEEVKEKFGLMPNQIADYLGLKGDASDNIPGVPKVGEKTAVSLLNEFGTIENALDNLEAITKKSIKKTLSENKDQGLLSKELATINTEVPIDWSLESLKMGHCDLEALLELMQELEFRTTANRILNSKLNPMGATSQSDLFGNPIDNGTETVEADFGLDQFDTSHQQYSLIEDRTAITKLVDRIKKQGSFCFDTETTSLNAMQAELVGISICLKAGEAYYIPTPDDFESAKEIVQAFAEVLTDPTILKIGQNIKYDALILRHYGVVVASPTFDTMLAHYVDRPSGKHGMDAMAKELLHYQPISIETLIGKKGKNQKSMRDIPVSEVVTYASEDADITWRLYEILEPKVKDDFIFEKIEQQLMPVLTDMEYTGVRIDEAELAKYSEELSERLVKLEKEIYEAAGEEFNINSPKQLGEILFGKLKLGKGEKAKKTKSGQYATNEQILMELAIAHELPAKVLSFRGITKLKSTYVDALPKLINPSTGRVHTTYSQTVAVTGRLSSLEPNLQNIPIRTDDGREVRKGFIPKDNQHVLLSADYSQVELRLMASLSGDENMIQAFQAGADIHRDAAARVFGVKPEEVTATQRSQAKQVNFGIIYGISAFGLSQRMGISRSEASDIIDTYFKTYPGIKTYMDQSIDFARKNGYVETHYGRRRYLPDILSKNATVRGVAERNAINSPIQGTAADIIKLAMINIFRAFEEADLQSKMILQVHDELVFDVYKEELDQVKHIVTEHMMGAADMTVPLEIEMGTGNNWLEAH